MCFLFLIGVGKHFIEVTNLILLVWSLDSKIDLQLVFLFIPEYGTKQHRVTINGNKSVSNNKD